MHRVESQALSNVQRESPGAKTYVICQPSDRKRLKEDYLTDS